MKSLFLFLSIIFCFNLNAQKDKRTPFDKVIYKQGRPYVCVNGKACEIKSIENIPIEKYLQVGAYIDPNNYERGFHRYIHYSWDHMGIERNDSVTVVLDNGVSTFTKSFALKIENRDLATSFHDSIITTYKVDREHHPQQRSEFQYLSTRIDTIVDFSTWISKEDALQDLDYLEWELVNNYSYLNYKSFDYEQALDVIRQHLEGGISRRDLARQLQMFAAKFGDGHTRISRREIILEKERLPFKITQKAGKFYGLSEILSIEDVPIDQLWNLALNYVPKTTIGFQEYAAERLLNYIVFFLKEAGVKTGNELTVKFVDRTDTFALVAPPRYEGFDLLKDTIFEDNIGYLAIREEMSDDENFLSDLDSALDGLLKTEGLIIDIRSNGGGSRMPLLKILPLLIKKAKIASVGTYRIDENKDFKPALGYLERRFMYPFNIDTSLWDEAEYKIDLENFKITVAEFKKTFNPSVEVADSLFSDFHYMLIEPSKLKYYDKPVIVLINEQCFSASDIFAAGIRLGDNVKLMGKTSGGGSGFSKTKDLPNSALRFRHSRMFSYQPNGRMYDGQGVSPDIVWEMEENMIEKAREILSSAKKSTVIESKID